ncbi:Nucleoside-diphosphate-sugar epimerase [Mesonia phycicola]|uniref:Nucleoside-diphosphate-sugar epimerase n=1 Tax=Mesonia phycicola TaxID=579105 RepID=A0A1M6ENI5_9FLAO|nr:NAD(P)H-binding protein [Mesonia phycicola]SHI87075.1 Nucleoside-diphosphate-sugar epimerase [Mesonia phycicola]
MKTVSILGCGWLGLPLAERLIEKRFTINGSTTTLDKIKILKSKGINSFYVELTEEEIKGEVFSFLNGVKILVIDIPPGLRKNPNSNFVKKAEHLIKKIELSCIEKVVFISSTSVFEDALDFPEYNETSIPNGKSNSAQQLLSVEKLLQSNSHFKTTIVRMGGLIGENRHPVKFLSGRKGISSGDAPVNLIQQKDCIALIEKVLELDAFAEVFHGVYPSHPTKKDYYQEQANDRNLELPEFDENSTSTGKIISSTFTEEKLNFSFTCEI